MSLDNIYEKSIKHVDNNALVYNKIMKIKNK